MEVNLRTLLSNQNIQIDNVFTEAQDVCFLSDDHYFPITSSGLSPEEFLAQAESDFEIGGQSALLNSITNAKRAIQCQIDQWVLALGLNAVQKKKKIELLNQIGYAPRIFKKVMDSRNLLEHEYKTPTIQDVEDALDLAWLFVSMSNTTIIPISFILANQNKYSAKARKFRSGVRFHYFQEKKKFNIASFKILKKDNYYFYEAEGSDNIEVKNTDDIYIPMIRLMLSIGTKMEHRERKALVSLWDHLEKNIQ